MGIKNAKHSVGFLPRASTSLCSKLVPFQNLGAGRERTQEEESRMRTLPLGRLSQDGLAPLTTN